MTTKKILVYENQPEELEFINNRLSRFKQRNGIEVVAEIKTDLAAIEEALNQTLAVKESHQKEFLEESEKYGFILAGYHVPQLIAGSQLWKIAPTFYKPRLVFYTNSKEQLVSELNLKPSYTDPRIIPTRKQPAFDKALDDYLLPNR